MLGLARQPGYTQVVRKCSVKLEPAIASLEVIMGKGSTRRPEDWLKIAKNWEDIDWGKKDTIPKKVNGDERKRFKSAEDVDDNS
jgi:hypothetical protein